MRGFIVRQPVEDVQGKSQIRAAAEIGIGEKIAVTDDDDPLLRRLWLPRPRFYPVHPRTRVGGAFIVGGEGSLHGDTDVQGSGYVGVTVKAQLAFQITGFRPGTQPGAQDPPCPPALGLNPGDACCPGKYRHQLEILGDRMGGVGRNGDKSRVGNSQHSGGGIDHDASLERDSEGVGYRFHAPLRSGLGQPQQVATLFHVAQHRPDFLGRQTLQAR